MGLDLIVEGCARPGHEVEWRDILERYFVSDIGKELVERFDAISIPAYARVDAPRVGFDPAADAWIIEARNASGPDEITRVLEEYHGYYVLRLVKSEGVPLYSHGGLYEGVDETSFRGAFLTGCGDVLPTDVIEAAWEHKFPEQAVAYGRALLALAESSEASSMPPKLPTAKRGLLSRFLPATPQVESFPFDEQLEIVRAAGKWFVFWGERRHAIRPWF